MCLEHQNGISRRRLGSLVVGAAGSSLLPFAARAAEVGTLCVTCIDFRFVAKDVTWLNAELNFSVYDQVALAGASLAGTDQRPKVPQNPQAFWDQIAIAQSLHHISQVFLVDHMDCGAYREAFGPMSPEDELKKHKEVLSQVAGILRSPRFDLKASCYVMPLEGAVWPIPN